MEAEVHRVPLLCQVSLIAGEKTYVRVKLANKLKLEFDTRTTVTENTSKSFAEFIENFYGTYFYSDA